MNTIEKILCFSILTLPVSCMDIEENQNIFKKKGGYGAIQQTNAFSVGSLPDANWQTIDIPKKNMEEPKSSSAISIEDLLEDFLEDSNIPTFQRNKRRSSQNISVDSEEDSAIAWQPFIDPELIDKFFKIKRSDLQRGGAYVFAVTPMLLMPLHFKWGYDGTHLYIKSDVISTVSAVLGAFSKLTQFSVPGYLYGSQLSSSLHKCPSPRQFVYQVVANFNFMFSVTAAISYMASNQNTLFPGMQNLYTIPFSVFAGLSTIPRHMFGTQFWSHMFLDWALSRRDDDLKKLSQIHTREFVREELRRRQKCLDQMGEEEIHELYDIVNTQSMLENVDSAVQSLLKYTNGTANESKKSVMCGKILKIIGALAGTAMVPLLVEKIYQHNHTFLQNFGFKDKLLSALTYTLVASEIYAISSYTALVSMNLFDTAYRSILNFSHRIVEQKKSIEITPLKIISKTLQVVNWGVIGTLAVTAGVQVFSPTSTPTQKHLDVAAFALSSLASLWPAKKALSWIYSGFLKSFCSPKELPYIVKKQQLKDIFEHMIDEAQHRLNTEELLILKNYCLTKKPILIQDEN